MTASEKVFIAFDLGASGGRCLAGHFDGGRLRLEVISRFPNDFVRVRHHWYWDVLALWQHIQAALRVAAQQVGRNIASIAVDGWGVDFALVDANGNLLGAPRCYRDPYTEGMIDKVLAIIPREELFQITGIQFLSLNTLYQLMALRHTGSPLLDVTRTLLMIPDLVNYWLTGQQVAEYTNASTTQLLNARARRWETSVMNRLNIPSHIFPNILDAGTPIDSLHHLVQDATGLGAVPVYTTASHDTASAVVGVPAECQPFAYLSSGTWGLLGTEVAAPLLSSQVQAFNFGNEGGAYGTIRLLRNMANMWLVQENVRLWKKFGQQRDWEAWRILAEQAPAFQAFIDPDAPDFLIPPDMPAAIREYCMRTGQPVPQTEGAILRVCFESLAMKYRYVLRQLTLLTGEQPEHFHIIGGASRNRLLNQFAANALAIPVIAGPSEAAAIGNLIVQMIGCGELRNLEEGRALIRASVALERVEPQQTAQWEEQYQRFLAVTGLPIFTNND